MALPVAPFIGAGLGALGSIFGGRPSGPDPASREAMDYWRRIMAFGGQGMGAVSGDPSGIAAFMNPYEAALNPFWDEMRKRTLTEAGSRASLAGAFGGSRQAVTEGTGLADIAGLQAGQRYGEFSSAMARALAAAGMGQSASGDLFRGGDYLRSIREGRRSNLFGSMLGGATAAYGMFPGGGGGNAGPTPGIVNTGTGNALFDEWMRGRRMPTAVTSPFGGF